MPNPTTKDHNLHKCRTYKLYNLSQCGFGVEREVMGLLEYKQDIISSAYIVGS